MRLHIVAGSNILINVLNAPWSTCVHDNMYGIFSYGLRHSLGSLVVSPTVYSMNQEHSLGGSVVSMWIDSIA